MLQLYIECATSTQIYHLLAIEVRGRKGMGILEGLEKKKKKKEEKRRKKFTKEETSQRHALETHRWI